jgi:hypothetical protein
MYKLSKKSWLEKGFKSILSNNSLLFFCHYNDIKNSFFNLRRRLNNRHAELKIVKNSTFKRISPVFNTGLLIYSNNRASSIIDNLLFLKSVLGDENSISLLYCKIDSLYLSIDSLEGFLYSFNRFGSTPISFLASFLFKYFFSFFFIFFGGFRKIIDLKLWQQLTK